MNLLLCLYLVDTSGLLTSCTNYEFIDRGKHCSYYGSFSSCISELASEIEIKLRIVERTNENSQNEARLTKRFLHFQACLSGVEVSPKFQQMAFERIKTFQMQYSSGFLNSSCLFVRIA